MQLEAFTQVEQDSFATSDTCDHHHNLHHDSSTSALDRSEPQDHQQCINKMDDKTTNYYERKQQIITENNHQDKLSSGSTKRQAVGDIEDMRMRRGSGSKGDNDADDQQQVAESQQLPATNGVDHHQAAAAAAAAAATASGEAASASATSQLAPFKAELVWTNIILFVILHSCLPVGLYMLYTQRPWKTLIFSILGIYASGLGVTGGSHRLWSHRAYKAKWPVQVLLTILQTMAGQNSIYTWSRDHRVHHKYSETDADPHNIKRGFFFAHMGWLCCRKHPDVKEKGKQIDMSDLEANPYVMFQHRHFWWMAIVFTVLVPTMIPVLLWGERFWTSFVFSFMVRYLITLHGTWLVNSAAHYYGDRPYDTRIEARESPYVIYNALGEGFHNYHHTFPYDYATSEFGRHMNITTTFIDLCASLGLVHDRRKVDSESILKRRARTGDLSEAELERRQQAAMLKLQRQQQQQGQETPGVLRNRRSGLQKLTIEEQDEQLVMSSSVNSGNQRDKKDSNGVSENGSSMMAPLNNIIHELPYISGLTSMKYTM